MNKGFSLLELSIVLVIIGLIAGGIVAGASMIRAAELRSVLTQHEQFKTAVYIFKDKYFALPGDMKNATAFWGTVGDTGGGTCTQGNGTSANMGNGTETCDGNGDGSLGTRLVVGETFRFWQHLANAELIEGQYAGVGAHSSGDGLIADPTDSGGVNQLPSSKLGSNAFWAIWAEAGHVSTFYSATNKYLYKNALMLETDPITPRGIGHNVSGVIAPDEAWNLDKKIDDGKPATGKLHVGIGGTIGTTACYTSTTPTTAEYAVSVQGNHCMLYFITNF